MALHAGEIRTGPRWPMRVGTRTPRTPVAARAQPVLAGVERLEGAQVGRISAPPSTRLAFVHARLSSVDLLPEE